MFVLCVFDLDFELPFFREDLLGEDVEPSVVMSAEEDVYASSEDGSPIVLFAVSSVGSRSMPPGLNKSRVRIFCARRAFSALASIRLELLLWRPGCWPLDGLDGDVDTSGDDGG